MTGYFTEFTSSSTTYKDYEDKKLMICKLAKECNRLDCRHRSYHMSNIDCNIGACDFTFNKPGVFCGCKEFKIEITNDEIEI